MEHGDDIREVPLSEESYMKLKHEWGREQLEYVLRDAGGWLYEHPKKKYKNWERFIRNWRKRSIEAGKEYFHHPEHGPGFYYVSVIKSVLREMHS